MGAANWAYSKATGQVAGAKNIATGKSLSDWRGQRRQRAVNARWAKNNPGISTRAGHAVKRSGMAAYRKVYKKSNSASSV